MIRKKYCGTAAKAGGNGEDKPHPKITGVPCLLKNKKEGRPSREGSRRKASNTPAIGVRLIAEALRDQVMGGVWAPGQRIETEEVLAARFGVCRATISKAMRLLQDEGFFLSKRGQGRFVSERVSSLRGRVVELVIGMRTDLTHPVTSAIVQGVQSYLAENDFRVNIRPVDITPISVLSVSQPHGELAQIDPKGFDGMLLMDCNLPLGRVLQAAGQRPVVWMEHDTVWPRIKGIRADHLGMGYDAAEYLFKLGHRRFGTIMPAGNLARWSWNYREGTRLFLGKHGGDEHAWGRVECPVDSVAEGRAAALTLLALPLKATALLCASDDLAVGVLEAARELGLHVPRDISVISYGPLDTGHGPASEITAYRYDFRELGRGGAQRLVELIVRPEDVSGTAFFPAKLVEGTTTGPGPAFGSTK